MALGSNSPPPEGVLDRARCQVGGVNQNYSSPAGTTYHIQIEDRGPVTDAVSEREVRRVNVIIYANYGEPQARIIHGSDHDFEDRRTHGHNRFVEEQIQRLAQEARGLIADWEERTVARIKTRIREYYETRSEEPKREFAEANTSFPFLFSRAWTELKREREQLVPGLVPAPVDDGPEVHYPLDVELRDRVIEIERLIIELGRDLHRLKEQGFADDILMQTCRKLVTRAKESLSGREATDFNARRLEMTRNSLITTWKQVRSRLKG